jgi:acetate kinase
MSAASLGVLNAGSSSIKFAVRSATAGLPLQLRGQVEAIGVAPRLVLKSASGELLHEQKWEPAGFDHAAATREIVAVVDARLGKGAVTAVGHRVVHGGTHYAAPHRVDEALLADLETLIPLAPLHQPHNLAPMRAIAAAAPRMPQVACFDTAFHASQPMIARRFGLPRKFDDEGVLRYGFHGLSYEYVSGRLRELTPRLAAGRTVIAHLGNGASLCAVQGGKSIATTMGFTAVEGLLMGTRCGAIDPGVLVYLMDEHQMGPREIEDLIYKRSGLLGVSGISPDMRTLRDSKEPAAAEAIALFVYRVQREIGSMAAALGGLDGLVFTAGIGENDAAVREEVVTGCGWLGLKLDPARNKAGKAGRISSDDSVGEVWIVPTDEESMIASHMVHVLGLKVSQQ